MTPDRLKEVEAVLSSPLGVKADRAQRLGLKLLAEVKRLRETLEKIEGHECPHWDSAECDCEYELRDRVGSALAGEEPTP